MNLSGNTSVTFLQTPSLAFVLITESIAGFVVENIG
jgi:hypothetical protein